MIILLILMTISLDYVLTLLGENWYWSPLGNKGLQLLISSQTWTRVHKSNLSGSTFSWRTSIIFVKILTVIKKQFGIIIVFFWGERLKMTSCSFLKVSCLIEFPLCSQKCHKQRLKASLPEHPLDNMVIFESAAKLQKFTLASKQEIFFSLRTRG